MRPLPPGTTLDDVAAPPVALSAVWGRRAFLSVLLVFVLAGASGWLGSHTTTTRASTAGYDLSVHYASVAQAGLDEPLVVTVEHPGGFGADVSIAVTADYFDIFETQGFTPDPSDATRDGSTLYLTFSAPKGDVFRFSYDAYIQPASQVGKSATISVLVHGVPVVSTHLTTHLLP